MLWHLLITGVLLVPYADGSNVPGDVLFSHLLGASDTQENCEEAAKILTEELTTISGGRVRVAHQCLEMDIDVIAYQGFEATK